VLKDLQDRIVNVAKTPTSNKITAPTIPITSLTTPKSSCKCKYTSNVP
jgi:hypothetical protein